MAGNRQCDGNRYVIENFLYIHSIGFTATFIMLGKGC